MGSFDIVANGEFRFYVIEDLKQAAFPAHHFQSLNEALDTFESLDTNNATVPTLGIQRGECILDLVQQVNGAKVLCQDYKNENLAEPMKALGPILGKIVGWLHSEAGVQYSYSHDLFSRVFASVPVVVPIGKESGKFDNICCADKRLKTIGGGLDSINQLFIDGHGWVNYLEIMDAPDEYCKNGVLSVSSVNVNYSLKQNLHGIDGQMNISVHDFSLMLEDINKEFALLVYEPRMDSSYVVASYSTEADAVRAWYELPVEATAFVNQTVGYNYRQTVFNGLGDDFEEITYEAAAKLYGFNVGEVDKLILSAESKSMKTSPGSRKSEIGLD